MSTEMLLLRDAAGLMRERARAASEGPWETGDDGLVWPPRTGDPVSGSTEIQDAAHIASWHPAVALAVADWLDAAAGQLEDDIPGWTRPSSGVDDPPARCWNNPQRLAEVVEHHYGRPLAVARAYVGGVA